MHELRIEALPAMIGETSPFHSSSRQKAKEKRTLVKWPVLDS
jgi:hypothetical protein